MLFVILFSVSLLTAVFMIGKVRKSQFLVEDTLYWIFFCVILILLSLFPGISVFFCKLLGFMDTQNFLFVVFIFLLLIKVFLLSVRVSSLESKLNNLVQKYAIDHQEKEKDKKE